MAIIKNELSQDKRKLRKAAVIVWRIHQIKNTGRISYSEDNFEIKKSDNFFLDSYAI